MALQYVKLLKDPEPFLYSFRQRHGMFAPVPRGITDFQQPITSDYFTERPQMIWVGFQVSNTTNQTVNYALYKHSSVETMWIQMNSTQIPPVTIKVEGEPLRQFSRKWKWVVIESGHYIYNEEKSPLYPVAG